MISTYTQRYCQHMSGKVTCGLLKVAINIAEQKRLPLLDYLHLEIGQSENKLRSYQRAAILIKAVAFFAAFRLTKNLYSNILNPRDGSDISHASSEVTRQSLTRLNHPPE